MSKKRSVSGRDRHAPHTLGLRGERLAALALRRRGWRIVASNYRVGRREVDLVARRGDVLAFVEVKTRAGGGFGAPEEAVTRLKRREIEAVAAAFLSDRPHEGDVRFDTVGIVVDEWMRVVRLTHTEDAWRPEAPR